MNNIILVLMWIDATACETVQKSPELSTFAKGKNKGRYSISSNEIKYVMNPCNGKLMFFIVLACFLHPATFSKALVKNLKTKPDMQHCNGVFVTAMFSDLLRFKISCD